MESKRPAIARSKPTVARLLLDAPVLPLATETIRVAEFVRNALMGRFTGWCVRNPAKADPFRRLDHSERFSSTTFSGRLLTGEMRKDHDHAFYLPTVDVDDPTRITHVIVYAPEGFGEGEVAALTGLQTLPWNEENAGLQVQLVGLGKPKEFNLPMFAPSQVWRSATPFIVHRHLKTRGQKRDTPHLIGEDWRKAFAKLSLEELIGRHGLPKAVVEPIKPPAGCPSPQEFRRERDRGHDDGFRRPFGWFRIEFAEPVSGPLVLGHNAHYGLGLFVPGD